MFFGTPVFASVEELLYILRQLEAPGDYSGASSFLNMRGEIESINFAIRVLVYRYVVTILCITSKIKGKKL